jgi:hypothetical protein
MLQSWQSCHEDNHFAASQGELVFRLIFVVPSWCRPFRVSRFESRVARPCVGKASDQLQRQDKCDARCVFFFFFFFFKADTCRSSATKVVTRQLLIHVHLLLCVHLTSRPYFEGAALKGLSSDGCRVGCRRSTTTACDGKSSTRTATSISSLSAHCTKLVSPALVNK